MVNVVLSSNHHSDILHFAHQAISKTSHPLGNREIGSAW